MIIGYARVSTSEQDAGLEAQLRDLRAFGAEKIFREKVSSVSERDQLNQALAFLREGDALVVTKPDRLARNTAELLTIETDLTARKIGLVVLSIGGERIDTRSATSRLILTILGGVAEWERKIMLERQKAGIASAKAEGKYKGRAPTARAKAAEIARLAAEGVTREETAARLGIGVASVYRILAETRHPRSAAV